MFFIFVIYLGFFPFFGSSGVFVVVRVGFFVLFFPVVLYFPLKKKIYINLISGGFVFPFLPPCLGVF